MRPVEPGPKRTWDRLTIAGSLVIVLAVAGLGWWVVVQIRAVASHIELAEARLAAVREACGLVLDYVDQRHDWPRSWEELRSLKRWTYARDPSGWSPPLQESVTIDFGAPLEEVREETPATFHAIRPRGGAAAVPLEPDYATFLSQLRVLVPRQKEAPPSAPP